MADSLQMLTQKDASFEWNESKETEFQQLKYCIITAPMLEIFDNSHETQHKVHMDASDKTLGTVLL